MEKQQIIGLAQQGDLEAIANLLNQSLAQYDTIAKVGQSTECLFVTLISNPVPDEETVIPIILQEIERWKNDSIKKIKIYGRTESQITPAWEDEISLENLPHPIPTQFSQEPPTILKKPPLETNNSEPSTSSTDSKPAFKLKNLPMWGKGAVVALFASASAGGLALLSNQLQTNTTAPTISPIPVTTPSASPTPTTTPTTKPTTEPPKATVTPTPTTTPKTTNTTNPPTTNKRRRRTETTSKQTQTEPTHKTQKRRKTQSTTNQTPTETKKTETNNNSQRSTQRTTTVPKKTTPKPTQRTTPTTPQVKPTPRSTSQPIYVPPPEKKSVETVPKSVNTPVQNNTNTNRRNTDITPPSAPANRRNIDVTPPSAPASKKEDTTTGDSP
jgi:hypothetical protein